MSSAKRQWHAGTLYQDTNAENILAHDNPLPLKTIEKSTSRSSKG